MSVNELEVSIGSVALNQSLGVGDFYLLRNTPELLSTLSTRKTDKDIQGGHGSEDSLSFYGPRILRFEGEMHASSQAARITMEKALRAAVALPAFQSYAGSDGYVLLLITDEDGIAKQLYAKVLEPPIISLIDDGMPESRRFEFVMYAKDPRIYAQTLTEVVGPESFLTTNYTIKDGALPTIKDGALPTIQESYENELNATNAGTYATPPVMIVEGPSLNPVIMNLTTGRKMSFSAAGGVSLGAGDILTITLTGTPTMVKTSGVVDTDVSGKLSSDSDLIFLEPGLNVLTLTDDSSDALESQLTVRFRSVWL